MARKLYETKKSLAAEKVFAEDLEKYFQVNLKKLPMQYGLDFIALDKRNKKPQFFLELKERRCNRNTYPTYIISLAKFMKAKEIYRSLNLHTFLCVRWKDVTGYMNMDDIEDHMIDITVGGRYDRNDWQDVEPLLNLEIGKFTIIGDTE
jgi:uncharacterized protein YcsI (UPF0317 family)|tara:strand:+ start:157 stop:603 length:447 start_codon:yes stop_codon:yes gene_type:complete